MDYEKKYKDALEWARKVMQGKVGFVLDEVLEKFPELREESEDERIRKSLIDMLKNDEKHYLKEIAWLEKQQKPVISDNALREGIAHFGITQYQIDNWLKKYVDIEKQGEQKTTNIVEPKFKVGQTIRLKERDKTFIVKAIKDFYYELSDDNVCEFKHQDSYELVEQTPPDKVEPKFHEGDWVVSPNGVYWHIDKIFNSRYEVTANTGEQANWPLDTNIYHKFNIQDAKDGDVLVEGNLPFIFKKIDTNKNSYAYCGISVDDGFKIESDGESGEWTWMQDINPATKEQRDQLEKAMADAGYRWNPDEKKMEKIEQKPADKVEPKFKVGDVIEVKPMKCHGKIFTGKPNKIVDITEESYILDDGKAYSIELQDGWKLSEQNPAWSEEDEEMLDGIIVDVEVLKEQDRTKDGKAAYQKEIDWLKSLRPHSQWKPSERQKEALLWCVVHLGGADKQTLGELLEELNKL